MKKIVVSAPGKIHLSGEHAVVYGKPAILAAVSKRLYITVSSVKYSFGKAQDGHVTRKENEVNYLRKKHKFLNEIIKIVEKRFKTKIKDVNISIKSDIPVGSGMGSSAALAASVIGALIKYLGKPWDVAVINDLSYQAEKFQHGNPSGGDPAVVCSGGWLWYRKELPFLKLFQSLNFQLPAKIKFILMQTSRKETTGEIVSYVSKLKSQQPEFYQALFDQIEQATKNLLESLYKQNTKRIKQAIQINQNLLEKLGVVSKTVQKLIREIENLGGAAKISGAGGIKNGSGIVLCCHDNIKTIANIAKKYKYDFFQVKLGEPGVRIE